MDTHAHDPEAELEVNLLMELIHRALRAKDPATRVNLFDWGMEGEPRWLAGQLREILAVLYGTPYAEATARVEAELAEMRRGFDEPGVEGTIPF